MKNYIKKIVLLISSFIVFNTGILAQADTEIQSGVYSLKNSVYHESEIGMSMSRSYLDDTMLVKITKEEVVFTIGFSGTQYMNNYRIKVDGAEVPVQVVEENKEAGTIKLQASAMSKDVKLSAAIYVDPMGRDVEFDIIPDYSSMVLLEAIEETAQVENLSEEVTEEAAESESVESDVEDNESQNNYIKIVVPAAVVVVVCVGLAIAFKKKK